MKVTVTTAARLDLATLMNVYDAKPERHGDDMLDEFARTLEGIGYAPRRHSPVDDPHPGFEAREGYVKRFQQRVIFVIVGDEVLVVAVVHATRRPGAWHRRLDTFQ
jgi:hypothetical protein